MSKFIKVELMDGSKNLVRKDSISHVAGPVPGYVYPTNNWCLIFLDNGNRLHVRMTYDQMVDVLILDSD